MTYGYVLDDEMGVIRVSTEWLGTLVNPLESNPWTGSPLTALDVSDAMVYGSGGHEPVECQESLDLYGCDSCEVQRIAHFVQEGWTSTLLDPEPITLDVGVGNYFPEWMLVDGNHRVAAAIVGGVEWVDVSVHGSWDRAVAMLIEGKEWQDVA